MPNLILSPSGTSLLTDSRNDKRSFLNKEANATEAEVSNELKQLIAEIQQRVSKELTQASVDELKRKSAELNSILRLYNDKLKGHQRDMHFLVVTDTFQTRITSKILQEYLTDYFDSVQVIVPPGFSTHDKRSFRSGIKYLLKWCDETLNAYKDSGYEITFNLTGGFKSLQGYLNTIGMFYADSIVYIFEGSEELITIPQLPIKIETSLFEEKAAIFLQLSQVNEGVSGKQIDGISRTFIEEYGEGKYTLSDWGELSWNKAKENVLKKQLISLPYLKYRDAFQKDFRNTKNPLAKVKLQEKLAFVSCQLQANNGDVGILKGGWSGGVVYDNYTGKNSHLGHFRVGKGPRVSCEVKDDVLELWHYGNHDYVNNNS